MPGGRSSASSSALPQPPRSGLAATAWVESGAGRGAPVTVAESTESRHQALRLGREPAAGRSHPGIAALEAIYAAPLPGPQPSPPRPHTARAPRAAHPSTPPTADSARARGVTAGSAAFSPVRAVPASLGLPLTGPGTAPAAGSSQGGQLVIRTATPSPAAVGIDDLPGAVTASAVGAPRLDQHALTAKHDRRIGHVTDLTQPLREALGSPLKPASQPSDVVVAPSQSPHVPARPKRYTDESRRRGKPLSVVDELRRVAEAEVQARDDTGGKREGVRGEGREQAGRGVQDSRLPGVGSVEVQRDRGGVLGVAGAQGEPARGAEGIATNVTGESDGRAGAGEAARQSATAGSAVAVQESAGFSNAGGALAESGDRGAAQRDLEERSLAPTVVQQPSGRVTSAEEQQKTAEDRETSAALAESIPGTKQGPSAALAGGPEAVVASEQQSVAGAATAGDAAAAAAPGTAMWGLQARSESEESARSQALGLVMGVQQAGAHAIRALRGQEDIGEYLEREYGESEDDEESNDAVALAIGVQRAAEAGLRRLRGEDDGGDDEGDDDGGGEGAGVGMSGPAITMEEMREEMEGFEDDWERGNRRKGEEAGVSGDGDRGGEGEGRGRKGRARWGGGDDRGGGNGKRGGERRGRGGRRRDDEEEEDGAAEASFARGGQAHDGRERHGESRSQETATFRTPKGDRPPRARNGGARVFPSPAGDAPAVPTPRSHLGLSGAAGRAEIEAAPLPGPATGHAQPWTPGAPSTLLGWRSGLGGWGRPGLWFPTPNGTLHTDVSGMSRFGAGLLPGTPGGRPGTGDLGTSATAPFVSGVGEVRSGAVADAALLGMAVFGRDDDGSGDDDDKNRGRKKAVKNDSDSEFEVSEKELKEARAAELDADVDYDHSSNRLKAREGKNRGLRELGDLIAQLRLRTHERQWMLTRFLDVIHKQQGEFKLNERWFRTVGLVKLISGVLVPVLISVLANTNNSTSTTLALVNTSIIFSVVGTVATALEDFFRFGMRATARKTAHTRIMRYFWEYHGLTGTFVHYKHHTGPAFRRFSLLMEREVYVAEQFIIKTLQDASSGDAEQNGDAHRRRPERGGRGAPAHHAALAQGVASAAQGAPRHLGRNHTSATRVGAMGDDFDS